MSRLFGLVSTFVVALGLAGCGGFSPEEATARCDQERDSRNAGGTPCVDDAAYDECVSAYEECGGDVTVIDSSCPLSYSCADQ